jgi:hypothetical protein
MAFSQSEITSVSAQIDGCELYISWVSNAAPNSCYQVYINSRLAWYGTATRCRVPIPTGALGCNTWVEAGTVAFDEQVDDFSANLTGRMADGRASLSWLGGTYLDPSGLDDVQGFRIYQSPAPGSPVDYTAAAYSLLAYPGGWISDGFGCSGFGQGGFGRAACLYQWTSASLSTGTWQFAVLPFDRAGNPSGPPQTASVSIVAAPRPPALSSTGQRLTYTYSGPSSRLVTLNWLASPA